MVERIVHFPVLNEIQQTIGLPKIVCTDEYLICHFKDLNINKLYAYSFSMHEWQVWQIDLPPNFFHLHMVILDQHKLVIHGAMEVKIMNTVYRTYMGDITERPIRFRMISTLEILAMNCDIASNGIDNLCAVIIDFDNFSDSSIEFFMHRLDTVNRWTRIPYDIQQNNIRLLTQASLYFMFVCGRTLFIFITKENEFEMDFTKLITFDLTTGITDTVNLRPADGPLPGFPHSPYISYSHTSLVQCPVEPGHAYLVFFNEHCNTSWEVWRVDVDAARWHRLPLIVDGPEASTCSSTCAAISPSGRLYLLNKNYASYPPYIDYGYNERTRPRPSELVRLSVRVPSLEDQCLDAAMEYLRAVDPDWPRARNVRKVFQWMKSKQRSEIDV